MQDGFVFQKPSLADVQSGQVKPRLFWVESTAYLLPTLSELLEACPQNFKGQVSGDLFYLTLWHEPEGWRAAYCRTIREEFWMGRYGGGPTPEEAVARLWLALHASTSPANHP